MSPPSFTSQAAGKVSFGRVMRACDDCRRLKEKCIGGAPCDRCRKSNRPCAFSDAFRRTRISRPATNGDALGAGAFNPVTFFDVERIRNLEYLVQHYTSIEQCNKRNLQQAVLKTQSESASGDSIEREATECGAQATRKEPQGMAEPAAGTGLLRELSHQHFAHRVRQEVLGDAKEPADYRYEQNASGEESQNPEPHSRHMLLDDVASLFPPADTVFHLLEIFFEFVQINYFYLDEATLIQGLTDYYSYPRDLHVRDAPWVCTVLMVCAISCQFSHLDSKISKINQPYGLRRFNQGKNGIEHSVTDALALALYNKACKLIPDVLAIASMESVQAFVLLGVYVLPFDSAGLSCNYLGMAVKIATQNEMHHSIQGASNNHKAEIRKRTWWTAYTLERFISLVHGRPVSISRLEVTIDLPVDLPSMVTPGRTNGIPNTIATLSIMRMMEEAREKIVALKNPDKSQFTTLLQSLRQFKDQVQSYWDQLAETTPCRDLTPQKPLFRSNVQLCLLYHLIHVFIGRSFLFHEVEPSSDDSESPSWSSERNELIEGGMESAVSIIELCQLLRDEFLSTLSSFTELTSCSAATFAIVARRTTNDGPKLKEASSRGLGVLKYMSGGTFSRWDKKSIGILQMAIRKLDGDDQGQSSGPTDDGYALFRDWVAQQKVIPTEMSILPGQDFSLPLLMDWTTESISIGGNSKGSHGSHKSNRAPTSKHNGSRVDEWPQYEFE